MVKLVQKVTDPATLTNQTTAPATTEVATAGFVSPSTVADAIDLDDLDAGERQAICIRRVIASGASAASGASFTIKIEVDTGA